MIHKFSLIISFSVLCVINTNAQFLKTSKALNEIELTDSCLGKQLGSILFVAHKCWYLEKAKNKKYSYYTSIQETAPFNYTISIVLARPSFMEGFAHDGIYLKSDGNFFIVNEHSENKLFKKTNKEFTFYYDKFITKIVKNADFFNDTAFPEEFCTWLLSYTNKELKILEAERVENMWKLNPSTNSNPEILEKDGKVTLYKLR